MGELIPLPPRSPDGDDNLPTTATFEIDGRHYEMTVTEDEVARLAPDLET